MAKWLGHVYDNGRGERPAFGKGSVADVVSHLPGVQRELRVKAAQLATIASLRLDSLPETRTGESQIGMQKRDLDWVVFLRERFEGNKGGSAEIERRLNVLGGAVDQMGG